MSTNPDPATGPPTAPDAATPPPERAPEPIPREKVRTTMQPDVELEVDATEAADLRAQGLLVDQDEPTLTERTLRTQRTHGNIPTAALEERQ